MLSSQFLRLEVWVLVDPSVWSTELCYEEADGIILKSKWEKEEARGRGRASFSCINNIRTVSIKSHINPC